MLQGITLDLPRHEVTAIIGPSGCGKSTFIRCLNRMHELEPGAWLEGSVRFGGHDVYAAGVDPVLLRRRVGMVFQRANPFPTLSIRDNVLAGLRLTGARIDDADAVVAAALADAALWDEVKDRLAAQPGQLTEGQRQRLCIARALAVGPEVLLMDEPCAELDPAATARVEDLVEVLGERYTIVLVTHNMQQAARVADRTAFFLDGRLIEFAPSDELFTSPTDARTEDYITGRFG